MKTIVIDGELLSEPKMDGMHRFMIQVLSRIDNMLDDKVLSSKLRLQLIYRKGKKIVGLAPKNIELVESDFSGKGYRYIGLPRYIKSINGIYCSMSNDAIRYKNSIFTIMDLIPLSPLAKFPFKSLLRMKLTYRLVSKYYKKVITISEVSRQDISTKLNIPKEHIRIVGTGWEHMNDIVADEDIFQRFPQLVQGNYFYGMGSQYPYKNFKWIIEVAKRNPDKIFCVAGKRTNIENGIDDSPENMIYTGYIEDGEHKALIKNSRAFLHPSKLEGFGIPPLEALSQGVPVIIANASCLPEIYGNTAHYIDPDNYDYDLDELLEEKVDEPDRLLKKYSWDQVAEDWLDIFLN